MARQALDDEEFQALLEEAGWAAPKTSKALLEEAGWAAPKTSKAKLEDSSRPGLPTSTVAASGSGSAGGGSSNEVKKEAEAGIGLEHDLAFDAAVAEAEQALRNK